MTNEELTKKLKKENKNLENKNKKLEYIIVKIINEIKKIDYLNLY